jgi:hypothetical protein
MVLLLGFIRETKRPRNPIQHSARNEVLLFDNCVLRDEQLVPWALSLTGEIWYRYLCSSLCWSEQRINGGSFSAAHIRALTSAPSALSYSLLTCSHAVPGSNIYRNTNYLGRGFMWFYSVANDGIEPWYRPRPLPSTSFTTHHTLIILQFGAK